MENIYFSQVSILSQTDHGYINLYHKVHLSYFDNSWLNLISKVWSSWQDFYLCGLERMCKYRNPSADWDKDWIDFRDEVCDENILSTCNQKMLESTTLKITFKDILKVIE